jgi:hypothetical protein
LCDLAPVRFGKSEVAKEFRAREIGRNGFKADARMPNGWLRDWELNNLSHPLTIAA